MLRGRRRRRAVQRALPGRLQQRALGAAPLGVGRERPPRRGRAHRHAGSRCRRARLGARRAGRRAEGAGRAQHVDRRAGRAEEAGRAQRRHLGADVAVGAGRARDRLGRLHRAVEAGRAEQARSDVGAVAADRAVVAPLLPRAGDPGAQRAGDGIAHARVGATVADGADGLGRHACARAVVRGSALLRRRRPRRAAVAARANRLVAVVLGRGHGERAVVSRGAHEGVRDRGGRVLGAVLAGGARDGRRGAGRAVGAARAHDRRARRGAVEPRGAVPGARHADHGRIVHGAVGVGHGGARRQSAALAGAAADLEVDAVARFDAHHTHRRGRACALRAGGVAPAVVLYAHFATREVVALHAVRVIAPRTLPARVRLVLVHNALVLMAGRIVDFVAVARGCLALARRRAALADALGR
mmetsp:Transcript_52470/g.109465  ORF Transcript_52470/g.109465 Transcript_52470/m.109465 type:complete len:414 (-) Transcript_52470:643-1884(-)